MKTEALTESETSRRLELSARNEANKAAWKQFTKHPHTSADEAQQAQINAVAPMSNEERAELETLNFRADCPRPEFLYPAEDVQRAPKWAFAPGFDSMKLTGFMGNVLMSVVQLGAEYRSSFGDTRRSVRATGINGAHYFGTIYGTYARMRPAKSGHYSTNL